MSDEAREAAYVKALEETQHFLSSLRTYLPSMLKPGAYAGEEMWEWWGRCHDGIRAALADTSPAAAALLARGEFKEYNVACGCKAVQGAIVFTDICRKHLSEGAKPGRLMGDDYARAALAPGEPCKTCNDTRVAPTDEDLGGEGVTMSPCPDCAPGEEQE